jgi:magnesium chelatase subunit D
LLENAEWSAQTGLIQQADSGVLYIDEVNLLPDHLVDSILDSAASGQHRIERDGLSKTVKARYILIGSMNPEEGDLRPQLKDRFGLSVSITTPQDVNTRMQIIQNRMLFDDDPNALFKKYEEEQKKIYLQIKKAQENLHKIAITEEAIKFCANLAKVHKVEGLRADVLLLKAARAYTAFLGNEEISEESIRKISPFVLNHRSNRTSALRPSTLCTFARFAQNFIASSVMAILCRFSCALLICK